MLIKVCINDILIKTITLSLNAKIFWLLLVKNVCFGKAGWGELIDTFIGESMKMMIIADQLSDLKCPMNNKFLVHHVILNILLDIQYTF